MIAGLFPTYPFEMKFQLLHGRRLFTCRAMNCDVLDFSHFLFNASRAFSTSSVLIFILLAISPTRAFFSSLRNGMFGKQISMLAAVLKSSTRMMQMQITLVVSPLLTPMSLSIKIKIRITDPYTASLLNESLASSLLVKRFCFKLERMPQKASITTAPTVNPTIISYPAKKLAIIRRRHKHHPHTVENTTVNLFKKCSKIIVMFILIFCFNLNACHGDCHLVNGLSVHLQLFLDQGSPVDGIIVKQHVADTDSHGWILLQLTLMEGKHQCLILSEHITHEQASMLHDWLQYRRILVVFKLYSFHVNALF
nr:MAG TPA: hypothetical protein [Caudoviricetes sp.]